MKRMVIVEGFRTAIGTFGGSLKDVPADMLLATCFQEVIKRTGIDPGIIDEVVAGNICSPSDSINIARVAALRAGIPASVPARTVARNCASGIESISSACQAFMAGDGEVFLVGGTESMSQVPYLIKQARFGQKLQHYVLVDGLWEGLVDPMIGQMMGRTAENVARKYNISRSEQDKFAVASHLKAYTARAEGKFRSQIVPVTLKNITNVGDKAFGTEKMFAEDECIKPKPDIQKMSFLPAIFLNEHISDPKKINIAFRDGKIVFSESHANKGSVTPGNSCPMSDAAAALLLMSEDKAKELGLSPRAYIVSYAYAGCDPELMGEGPIYAVPKALKKANLRIEDIDFFELNEAFAVQVLACQQQLNIPDGKLNVWGGAIALGHPIGATGSVLAVKAMHILEDTQKRYAAVTMCVGGGQGGCLIIERGAGKKEEKRTKAIRKVAVIGGGAMGIGIAMLIAQKGTEVVVKEMTPELAYKSLDSIYDKLDKAGERGKLTTNASAVKGLISAVSRADEIKDADLVIEAIFEKIEIKKAVFSELDKIFPPDVIFATNTSSLSISEIASVTGRQDRFIGMHFFNPPVTMPLVELISGAGTSEETLEAVDTFSRGSLGKVVIKVKECPAFLVNRMLMPYLNEAALLLTETKLSVEEIDAEAKKFGWPMGPFQLLDYLGMDVCAEVAGICHRGYGERAAPAPIMRKLVELGRLGNKTSAGFYENGTSDSLTELLSREYPQRILLSSLEGFRRMMAGMVNEAFLCLEEDISSADEIETGCIYGIGFPMALEGPLHWAEGQGLQNILTYLKRFEIEFGFRFKPAKLLEKYVAEGTRIFENW